MFSLSPDVFPKWCWHYQGYECLHSRDPLLSLTVHFPLPLGSGFFLPDERQNKWRKISWSLIACVDILIKHRFLVHLLLFKICYFAKELKIIKPEEWQVNRWLMNIKWWVLKNVHACLISASSSAMRESFCCTTWVASRCFVSCFSTCGKKTIIVDISNTINYHLSPHQQDFRAKALINPKSQSLLTLTPLCIMVLNRYIHKMWCFNIAFYYSFYKVYLWFNNCYLAFLIISEISALCFSL